MSPPVIPRAAARMNLLMTPWPTTRVSPPGNGAFGEEFPGAGEHVGAALAAGRVETRGVLEAKAGELRMVGGDRVPRGAGQDADVEVDDARVGPDVVHGSTQLAGDDRRGFESARQGTRDDVDVRVRQDRPQHAAERRGLRAAVPGQRRFGTALDAPDPVPLALPVAHEVERAHGTTRRRRARGMRVRSWFIVGRYRLRRTSAEISGAWRGSGQRCRGRSGWSGSALEHLPNLVVFHLPAEIRLDHGVVVLDLVRAPFGDLLAVVEHGDLLAGVHHHPEDVLDDDHGEPVALLQPDDDAQQVVPR